MKRMWRCFGDGEERSEKVEEEKREEESSIWLAFVAQGGRHERRRSTTPTAAVCNAPLLSTVGLPCHLCVLDLRFLEDLSSILLDCRLYL